MAPAGTGKVRLQQVVVTWTESPVRQHVGVPLASWAHADRVFAVMAQLAPTAYAHRTGFQVEWRDGQRYVGRMHLRASTGVAPDPVSLSAHVRTQLEVACGRRRPPGLGPEEWAAFLAAQGTEVITWAARLLDRYEIGEGVPAGSGRRAEDCPTDTAPRSWQRWM